MGGEGLKVSANVELSSSRAAEREISQIKKNNVANAEEG